MFWALLTPLFRLAVYYFVLSLLLGAREENFAFLLFSGLIIWMVFAESTNKGMRLLRSKRYLISSIQFNKIDLFIASNLTIFTGFVFNFLAYMAAALLYGIPFSFTILYMPIILIIVFVLSMGVGMILSIINLYIKDIQHLWSMILLFGFWTSGVFARTELFTAKFPELGYINPFLGIIDNARQIMMYGSSFKSTLIYSALYAVVVFLIGLFVFKRHAHLALEKI